MKKIGILGGGQLGQMFLQNAYAYPFELYNADPDPQAPCSKLNPNFKVLSLQSYQDVFNFGQDKDIISIEIENVNTQALRDLEKINVKVFPEPHVIELIANKCTQKEFFKTHAIPTADFVLIHSPEDLQKHKDFLPAVQKLAIGGYDGKGVKILENEADLDSSFKEASLLEKKVDIDKEIAVMVAQNKTGVEVYEPVEMVFDEKLNLVDYLIAPARISAVQAEKAQNLAIQVIQKLNMTGILAVEMFLDKQGNLLVNEVAPRPHNSGHHTIEAAFCSQYDQHLRAITQMPLGNSKLHSKAGMLNIIGAEGYQGQVWYEGLEKVLILPKTYLHLYNKSITKPGRKMGHFTVLGDTFEEIEEKILFLKENFFVKSL
ncbi:MAG: 5-(carboxyamino)imidazole ribonucleotide synthase [Raineya sp.]